MNDNRNPWLMKLGNFLTPKKKPDPNNELSWNNMQSYTDPFNSGFEQFKKPDSFNQIQLDPVQSPQVESVMSGQMDNGTSLDLSKAVKQPKTPLFGKVPTMSYINAGAAAVNDFGKMKWYKNGGFWDDVKDVGLVLGDTVLGTVGMHDVINDRAYENDWARNAGNIGSRVGQYGAQIAATAIGGPMAGAAVAAGQNALRSTVNNNLVEEQNRITQQGERNATMNYGRSTPLPFRLGGMMQLDDENFTEFKGNLHEEGGIPLGKNAEVEDGEVMIKTSDGGQYIFSDYIGHKSKKNNKKVSGKSYADEAKEINDRFSLRPYDAMSNRAKQRGFSLLTQEQEATKTWLETNENIEKERKYMMGGTLGGNSDGAMSQGGIFGALSKGFRNGGKTNSFFDDPTSQNTVDSPIVPPPDYNTVGNSLYPGTYYFTPDGKYYNGPELVTDPEAIKSIQADPDKKPYPGSIPVSTVDKQNFTAAELNNSVPSTTTQPATTSQSTASTGAVIPTTPATATAPTTTTQQTYAIHPAIDKYFGELKVGSTIGDKSMLGLTYDLRKFFNTPMELGISNSEMNTPRYGNKTLKMWTALKSDPQLMAQFIEANPKYKTWFTPQAQSTQEPTNEQQQVQQQSTSGAYSTTDALKAGSNLETQISTILKGIAGKTFTGTPMQTKVNNWAYAPGYVADYYNLYRGLKGPDPVMKYQYNPEYMNTRAQEVLAENAANNAFGTIRANLPRSSQAAYLASIGAAYSGIGDKLGQQQAQIRQQTELQNTQLANQAQLANINAQLQADQTRQQELDAARSWTSQGLASLADRTSQVFADQRANDQQNFVLKNLMNTKDFQWTENGVEQSVSNAVKVYMDSGMTQAEAEAKVNDEFIKMYNMTIQEWMNARRSGAGANAALASPSTGVKKEKNG